MVSGHRPPRAGRHGSVALAGLFGITASLLLGSSPSAAETHLPAMCNGRSNPDTQVVAISNGRVGNPKYVLSVATDSLGSPNGTLIVGQGSNRLEVTEWCRLWMHVPGTSGGGSCEDSDVRDDATTVHAVGWGTLRSGMTVTVRTDVRETDEGTFFRVRYRAAGKHHAAIVTLVEHEDDCEGGWVRIPAEGWLPLGHLHVGPAD